MTNTIPHPTSPSRVQDDVLRAMTPGARVTTAEVVSLYERTTGLRTTITAIREALAALSSAGAEGRKILAVDRADSSADVWTWVIEPGMGATYSVGSDRYACTVVAVSPSGHKITTRDDRAIRTDDNGMSDCQEYRYERDADGPTRTFYRDSKGLYGNKTKGGRLGLGHRRAYHDYSF